jgi:Second Messenger Oligonucleotide or Dinucleotide Synthetase domain
MATAEKAIWFQDSKSQLDSLSLGVCEELQLPATRYQLAVQRYGSVNELLERSGSPFAGYRPRIFPQGSMALGTTTKPPHGPHDLDFVLQIDAPYWNWPPLAALGALHNFLRNNEIYRPMVSLKNRVVRLTYTDEFYLDILPAYTDVTSADSCILVPDRSMSALCSSNPAGFIRWFQDRCRTRRRLLLETAKPIPPQEGADEKEPLQLCVQLLKRWRDLFFEDPCVAPSIVLTALAGMHYQGEESVSEALLSILNGILGAITLADSRGSRIEIRNHSNPREDFAERWEANPQAYVAFKRGIRQLQSDWRAILAGGRETHKELERLFGEYVRTVLVKRAQRLQEARKAGVVGLTSTGAITGLASRVTPIPRNTFHGDE